MKIKTEILFAILLITILTSVIFAENFENKNIQRGFIHTIGNKVIDEQGREIFLRGFAIDPFSYQSFKKVPNRYSKEKIFRFNKDKFKYFITEDDIINIKNMGGNVIRKQIHFYDLEIAPYKYDDNILQVFDELIERSYKHGVYVIISLTQAAQNTKQQDNMLAYGGKPLLWTDIEFQKRVIAFTGYMASHFANNPGIAGYDIINEPEPSSTKDLYSFYSNVINEIRKFDKEHIIILERAHFNAEKCSDNPFGGVYDDTNIMLSLHYYNDANERAKVNPKFVKYDNKEEIQKKIETLFSYPSVKGRSIFVGEFSALWDANKLGLQWTSNTVQLMNKNKIHWTYFGYKNIFGERRGLYSAIKWWKKGITKNQKITLKIERKQEQLLSTNKNYILNQEVKNILLKGFLGIKN